MESFQSPRDLKLKRAGRSPTPDAIVPISSSPRLQLRRPGSRSKAECLSPLIVPNKILPPSPLSQERPLGTSESSGFGSENNLLCDVQEVEEEGDGSSDFISSNYRRHRRNSQSLPDLRDTVVSMVSSPSSLNSYMDDYPLRLDSRFERGHTLGEGSPLPEVFEEEEPPLLAVPAYLRQRRGSASLPDLRITDPLISTKQGNRHDGDAEGPSSDCVSDSDSTAQVNDLQDFYERPSSDDPGGGIRLPQLNINVQLSSSLPSLNKGARSGFMGIPHNTIRRQKTTLNKFGSLENLNKQTQAVDKKCYRQVDKKNFQIITASMELTGTRMQPAHKYK